jgi:formylglycine-generating enzyme required for sulfatase activity
MGSPTLERGRDHYENQVPVTLTQGFWLMETECWQKLWVAVMSEPRNWDHGRGDLYPAYDVSHDDAVEFGRRLTSLLRESGQLNGNWEGTLPTSAQWEYAARAGSTTAYCFGDDTSRLGEYAWYDENSGKTNRPVGTKKPNAWGLHDMHGSLLEWCADWGGATQVGGIDPNGPASGSASVSGRVCRGGCWYYPASGCRSACRGIYNPLDRGHVLGFRLALSPVSGS